MKALIISALVIASLYNMAPTPGPSAQDQVDQAITQFNANVNEEEFDESEVCDGTLAVKLNIQGACLALGYSETPI